MSRPTLFRTAVGSMASNGRTAPATSSTTAPDPVSSGSAVMRIARSDRGRLVRSGHDPVSRQRSRQPIDRWPAPASDRACCDRWRPRCGTAPAASRSRAARPGQHARSDPLLPSALPVDTGQVGPRGGRNGGYPAPRRTAVHSSHCRLGFVRRRTRIRLITNAAALSCDMRSTRSAT